MRVRLPLVWVLLLFISTAFSATLHIYGWNGQARLVADPLHPDPVEDEAFLLEVNDTVNISLEFPSTFPIKEAKFYNVRLDGGSAELVIFQPGVRGYFKRGFGFSPVNLSFTEGKIYVNNAQGKYLYKCLNYSTQRGDCVGKWKMVEELKEDQPYVLSVSSTDPVWAESPYAVCYCTSCNECSDSLSNSACDVVILKNDIYSSAICIDNPKGADNKVLDCEGHDIGFSGLLPTVGVSFSDLRNFTIRRCAFVKWDVAVLGEYVSNFSINSSSFSKGTTGVEVRKSSDVYIYDSNFSTSKVGVRLTSVTYGLVEGNTFSSPEVGLDVLDSQHVVGEKNVYVSNWIGARIKESENVEVKGSDFLGDGKAAVYVSSGDGVIISNNTIINTSYTSQDPYGQAQWACDELNENFSIFEADITVCHSTNISSIGNVIKGNGTCNPNCGYNHDGSETGILYFNTTHSVIRENSLWNVGDNFGIHARRSKWIYIENNYVNGSTPGGDHNTNDGIPISLLDGPVYIRWNNVTSTYEWGIFLTYANNTYIEGNIITLADIVGIRVADSYSNNVTNNSVSLCREGVRVQNGNYNRVWGNYLFSNSYYGIYINSANETEVYSNVVEGNGVQIVIRTSQGNLIYNNIFNATSSTQEVAADYTGGSNYWNTSYNCSRDSIIGRSCIGGNWYSNYTGADDGSGSGVHAYAGDGIGDNPSQYVVSSGVVDYLPLSFNNSGYCNCNSCGTCEDRLNRTYCHYVEVFGDFLSSNSVCINAPQNFQSKVFDCAFHQTLAALSSLSVFLRMVANDNNIVANCSVNGFSRGVELYNVSNLTMYGMTLSNTEVNVFGDNVSDFNLTSTLSKNATYGAVLSLAGSDNYISNSEFLNSTIGVDVSGGKVSLERVNVSYCTIGVRTAVDEFTIEDSRFISNEVGLKSVSPLGYVSNSRFYSNLDTGIYLEGAEYHALRNLDMNWNKRRGVYIYRSGNIRVEDSSINYSDTGVVVNNSEDVVVYNTRFFYNRKAAVMVFDSGGFDLLKNYIYNTTNTSDDPLGDFEGACDPANSHYGLFEVGIGVCSSEKGNIEDNVIYSNGTCNPSCGYNHDGTEAGILLFDSTRINVRSNTLENAGDNYGIALSNSSSVVVESNYINGLDANGENNTNDGIIVRYSREVNVTQNTFTNAAEWGIFVPVSADLYIHSNSIFNSTVGIRLASTSNANVSENNISQVRWGIYVDAYSSEGPNTNATVSSNIVHNASEVGIYLGRNFYNPLNSEYVYNVTLDSNTLWSNPKGIVLEGYVRDGVVRFNEVNATVLSLEVIPNVDLPSIVQIKDVMVYNNTLNSQDIAAAFNATLDFYFENNSLQGRNYGLVIGGSKQNSVIYPSKGFHLIRNNITRSLSKGLLLAPESESGNLSYNYICYNALDIFNRGVDHEGHYDICTSSYNWEEHGHPGCFRTCSHIWHIFYGYVNASLLLGYNLSAVVYEWPWSGKGKVYVKNADVNVDWYSLLPLGRTIYGGEASSDFSEADNVLGTSGEADSIAALFSTDGTHPIQTVNLTIFDRNLSYIPIKDSILGSSFYTGILWDGSDGGNEFSETVNQDLIFFTPINTSEYAHYEVMVPAPLATYKGSSGMVEFWVELE